MAQGFKFIVDPEHQGIRLDKFLAEKFPDYSRSWLQKLVKQEKILVNGKYIKASMKLKAGDLISGEISPLPEINLAPDTEIKFKVVYEEKDFAVIEKPAGLVVHPSVSQKDKTLVNGILAKWPEIKNVGDPEYSGLRPGIVHRLDKDTSGLMLIAKNNKAFFYFKNLFKNRQIEKRYLTLALGSVKPKEGIIDLAISRSKKIPIRQKAAKKGEMSRSAVTYYKVLKYLIGSDGTNYTFLEAVPKTGRMHQIRVHFFSIGHGIVGDKVYKKRRLKFSGISRHFLHASFLRFASFSGKSLEFNSPLPEDLETFLEILTPAEAKG